MSKISVNAFLTLDGVMQAPGGPDEDGGWQAPFSDDVMGRQQPGRTVHTWGSTDLLQTLLKNDLIDEYRLFIYPVVLGSGKRLFGSGTVPVALKQVESVTTGKGVTFHRFERSGKPEYGLVGT